MVKKSNKTSRTKDKKGDIFDKVEFKVRK